MGVAVIIFITLSVLSAAVGLAVLLMTDRRSEDPATISARQNVIIIFVGLPFAAAALVAVIDLLMRG